MTTVTPFSLRCHLCDFRCWTWDALREHVWRTHRRTP